MAVCDRFLESVSSDLFELDISVSRPEERSPVLLWPISPSASELAEPQGRIRGTPCCGCRDVPGGRSLCTAGVPLLPLLIDGATLCRIFLVEYCPDCSFCCLLFDNKVQAKILKSSQDRNVCYSSLESVVWLLETRA